MTVIGTDGAVECRAERRITEGSVESFGYRLLGKLDNGIYVLLTLESGGGSGVFEDLLFVRFQTSPFLDQDRVAQRTILTCVGSFTLGDRDDGKVSVTHNAVRVGKSQYRDEDTLIDLSNL